MTDQIKAVIWDMGGVILRSEDWAPRQALAQEYGMTLEEIHNLVFSSDSGTRATLGEITEEEHWQIIARQLNLSTDESKRFQNKFWQGDRLDQSLVDFIRSLKPSYTTGLLSNAWNGARRVLTKSKPCIDAFHVSVFSCEVGLAKPDPAIYRYIIRLCGIEPNEAIFVDDFIENINAANDLGIHGIQFKSAGQAIQDVNRLLGAH